MAVWLRLYRAAVLLLAIFLVHEQTSWWAARDRASISIRLAREFFPTAERVQLRNAERGLHIVVNAKGDTVGALLRTSPFTDHIKGYAGPNDVLIALNPKGSVEGVRLLRSGDTPEHVRLVLNSSNFFRAFAGWKPNEGRLPKVDAVSGATLTSLAIAEGVEERLVGAAPSLRFPEPLTLTEVQTLFTNGAKLLPEKQRWKVLDISGAELGYVLRTSPQSDNVAGYRGPTDSLVGVGLDGLTVLGLRIRRSYDTESYVDQVRRSTAFFRLFAGRTLQELASFEYPRQSVDGISGATMTARAIGEGVSRRAGVETGRPVPSRRWKPNGRDWGLAAVIAGAMTMSLTRLRGYRWARVGWQAVLIGYVGLINHDFVSLALLGGWASHGLAWRTASGLVLLVAASLLVPWGWRRQVYCHQICPHGAAQQWLGGLGTRWKRWRTGRRSPSAGGTARRPRVWLRWLEAVPWLLLALAFVGLLCGWELSLTSLEPFDAWAWTTAGLATVTIAAVGLAASIFVPQAYCRFGCPTGALLSFMRSRGTGDRWTRGDALAGALIVSGTVGVIAMRLWIPPPPKPAPLELRGRTMLTQWSILVRDEVADASALQKAVAKEFEWAESLTSGRATNSDLAEFNRTLSTNGMAVPWPVVALARRGAEISRQTEGAYDLTAGPLADVWGLGRDPGETNAPPPTAEVERAREAVGWSKLEVLDGELRKQHPALELDLSSLATGWAIDQVARILDRRGYTNVLVEAGGRRRVTGSWVLSLEEPARVGMFTNESLAISGSHRKRQAGDSRLPQRLIDPRTGRPVTHRTVAVVVRHEECALAAGWATALHVLGLEEGLPVAERLALRAQFVVEQPDGVLKVTETAGWKERSALAGPVPGKRR